MLHVVGAGLAGLSAAVAAARAGWAVTLYEATDHAGGRCRSYHDPVLNRIIDNGTHLVMDVNATTLGFARSIGGIGQMKRGKPHFPFINVSTGQRWTLTPWALGRRPLDLLRALGLFGLDSHTTVTQSLGATKTFDAIWDPLNVAALNTASDQASAQQFAQLLRLALKRGPSSLNPWTFPHGLSAALVEPAIATLLDMDVEIHFNRRLRAVENDALTFDDQCVELGREDRVILALPPWTAHELFPHLPQLETRAIVNGHFLLDRPAALPDDMPWLGLTGGLGQWVSARDRLISVTISAADANVHAKADAIAEELWRELAPILNLPADAVPPCRIIKERRATIAHTPAMVGQRPEPFCPFPTMVMAGDWLNSPWPCTIEAAIVSGLNAARLMTHQAMLQY